MSTRPTIGITVDYRDEKDYYESPHWYAAAVEKAGGLPVLFPYRVDVARVPQYVDLIDGMLLSGGDDLDPRAWGEEYHPKTTRIDPLRERFERALLAELERRRTPTLGVCLGSQLMNVCRGGSMIQYLPEHERPNSIEHRKGNGDATAWNQHPIALEPDSIAARVIGQREIIANTSHKQAMNAIGRGLRVIARAPDGIIEGVEDPTMPLWLGVQWHPERLHDRREHLALFKLLVEKAASASPERT